MYTYIKAYANARKLYQTARVLPYVREKHAGQFRKGPDKVPYVYHSLLIACHAISLGMCDDDLLSAALLHDVCEDCNVPVEDLPVNDETKEAVALVTKDFKALENSIEAAAFDETKMASYIKETENYIYPLMDKTSDNYPEYANRIFLIKYHMISVIEAIKHDLARSIT